MCDLHFETHKGICCANKPKHIDLPKSVRRSYLDMYDECPYSLYQLLHNDIKTVGNVWSVVGNILHDLFEENSKLEYSATSEQIYEEYLFKLESYHNDSKFQFDKANLLTSYDVMDRMKDKGKSSIDFYLEYEKLSPKPMYTEHEIKLTISDDLPIVTMTLDRIHISPGFSEIVDYKTGKVYSGRDIVEGFQVATYILGFEEEFGYLPDRFTLVFVDEGKYRIINKIDDNTYVCEIRGKSHTLTLSDKRGKIKDLLTGMKENIWCVGNNLNAFKCENFCEIRQLGYCSGSQEQQFVDSFK